MTRRIYLAALLAAVAAAAARDSLRGKLRQTPGKKPAIEITPGKLIELEGDGSTIKVLQDRRLAEMDLEVIGERRSASLFLVGPIHTKSMFVYQDGKRLYITYWCDICSIRTYAPGKCWCCQEDTHLDLRERIEP